jgi:hypothetical protein
MRGSRDADAKLFQKRMKDAGVPEQIVFEADWLIETGANAGMASAAVRLQKAQQLAGMQNMPDMNGRAIRELLVTQLAGANAVKQFMLPAGGQGEPEQLRAALQENADFMQGLQLPAAPSDNHTVHLTVHLQSAGQIVMATDPLVARGQLPNGNAMRALMAGLEHAKQHLGFMGMDETRAKERKVFQDQFAMLESKAQKFMTAIARAQQQAQQQQAMRNAAAIEAGRRVEAQRLAVAQKERAEGPNGGRAEGLNGGGTQGEDAGL